MCGITAYLGKPDGGKYVLSGLKMLLNRGYDSTGCCSIKTHQPAKQSKKTAELVVTKFATNEGADSFQQLSDNFSCHEGSRCLIAHCRWATTGRVTDENAHPHLDTIFPNRFALVHNGIIENYVDLRNHLLDEEIDFRSETDTEVIVNFLAYSYRETNNLMDALKLTLQELEGTWALVVMDREEPDALYICKKGSPVLVGYSEDLCIVSSELSGFSHYLKKYHVVPDNHIIKAKLGNKIEFYREDKLTTLSTQTIIQQTLTQVSPDPYPYWTLKEIMEQPSSAMRALNCGGRIQDQNQVNLGGLKRNLQSLLQIHHLVILASGTSAHAGMLGAKFLLNIGGFETVRVVDASEFTLNDLTRQGAGVLAISQSGETRDVVRCLELIRENRLDVIVFSIVNAVESLIAREADCGVYLNAGREVAVASTKCFTNQVLVLILIAIFFAQHRKLYPERRYKLICSLQNVEDLISETLELMQEPCQEILGVLKEAEHIFILGREKGYPVALEGALKIKEISYIHAEGYAAGGLKHGPLALITQGTPIIVLRIGDSVQVSQMDVAAEETKSRGGYVISIGKPCPRDDLYEFQIPIASDQSLESLLSVFPLQYLAYLLSIELGFNPDFPRNLAKCVTVS